MTLNKPQFLPTSAQAQAQLVALFSKSIEVRNYDNARLNIMFVLYYNEEVRHLRGLLLVALFIYIYI